jgi:hypothetical protein
MKFKIAESVVCLVILLITTQSVSPAFFLSHKTNSHRIAFHSAEPNSSLESLLFEKTEEENNEDDRAKFVTVEIADFTRLAVYLSQVHTRNKPFVSLELRFDTQPPLFQRICALLI